MRKWLLLGCLIASGEGQAAVSLTGTRLVFDGAYREATIDVSNRSQVEVLIQAWLSDPGNAQATLPFVVTPHLTRIQAQGKQTLRLLYEGLGMPPDRESLLHLYVLQVPRRSEASQQLSIAIRQRINVFYRPQGLQGDPSQAAQTLAWQVHGGALKVSNPTSFHVALQNIALDGVELGDDLLLAPGSSGSFVLRGKRQGALGFTALTDYGGQRHYCAPLTGAGSVRATLQISSTGKC